jgi:hypothetical protein
MPKIRLKTSWMSGVTGGVLIVRATRIDFLQRDPLIPARWSVVVVAFTSSNPWSPNPLVTSFSVTELFSFQRSHFALSTRG